MSKIQDYSGTAPLRTEQSEQYDETLHIVKTQIDIMLRANNCLHAWLNEVQACINRARSKVQEHEWNQARDYYDE